MSDAPELGCGHDRVTAFWRALGIDVDRAVREGAPWSLRASGFLKRFSTLATPGLMAVFLHRLSHLLHLKGWRRTATAAVRLNFLAHKVTIGQDSCVGPGFYLPHPVGVIFHGRAGAMLTLYAESACIPTVPLFSGPAERGPRLGDRVSVGVLSALMGAITVGSDTRIGFRCVLARDVPPRSVVVSPAIRTAVSRGRASGGPTRE